MKVIHIASGDLWAGAENQVYQLLKELTNSGDGKFKLILFNHGKLEELCVKMGCDVQVIDERKYNGFKTLIEIYKVLKNERPDIVHTHGYKQNILGAFASFLAQIKASVRTIHGRAETTISALQPHKYLFHFLDTLSALMQQKYIVVADDLYEYSVKRYFNRSVLIENGIDVGEVINNSLKDTKATSNNEKIKVGLVGRLNPVKNPEMFIKIQKELVENDIDDFEFVLYGDGPLKSQLEDIVNDAGLSKVIKFLGHVDNIESEISNLDVLLITSQHEGLPMTLLEAMALKTPVISSNVGGVPEVLEYGKCGTLVNCGEPGGYVRELLSFRNDKSGYTMKAEMGYQRVKENYSSSHNALQYMNLYRELL